LSPTASLHAHQTVLRTGASQLAHKQIKPQRRLAPAADLRVKLYDLLF
jgi:hypothetical protein